MALPGNPSFQAPSDDEYQKQFTRLLDEAGVKGVSDDMTRRSATMSTLEKVGATLGFIPKLAETAAYNWMAKGRGLPTQSYAPWKSAVELSDVLKLSDPSLTRSRSFEKASPWLDLASSVALDPTTYLTAGASGAAKGVAAAAIKGAGLAVDAQNATLRATKAITTLDKLADGTHAARMIAKAGDVIPVSMLKTELPGVHAAMTKAGMIAGDKLTPASVPRLSKAGAEAYAYGRGAYGNYDKLHQRIMRGETGVRFMGKTILGSEIQGRAIQAGSALVDRAVEQSPMIAKAKDFLFSTPANIAAKINQIAGGPASTAFIELQNREASRMERLAGMTKLKEALSPAIAKYHEAMGAANPTGKMSGKEWAASARKQGFLNPDGLDKKQHAKIVMAFAERHDQDLADVMREGGIKADFVVPDPNNRIANVETPRILKVNRADLEALKPILEVVEKHVKPQIKETGTIIKSAIDDADMLRLEDMIRDNYARRVARDSSAGEYVGKEGAFIRQADELARVHGRKYRGDNVWQVENMRNAREQVIGKSDDVALKLAAILWKDTRLKNWKIKEAVSIGGRSDIDTLIKDAVAKGNNTLAETYQSAKEVAGTYNAWSKRWMEAGRRGTSKSDKVAEAIHEFQRLLEFSFDDVLQSAKNLSATDHYYHSVPLSLFSSQVDADARVASVKFFDELYRSGLQNGFISVGAKDKKAPDGWVNLYEKLNAMAGVPDDIAKEFGVFGANEATYLMRADMWNTLARSPAIEALMHTDDFFKRDVWSQVGNVIDELNRTFKKLTLFVLPTTVVRNAVDDWIKLAMEDPAIVKALPEAQRIIANNHAELMGTAGFSPKAHGTIKIFDGRTITDKEVWQMAQAHNLLGQGIHATSLRMGDFRAVEYLKRHGIIAGEKVEVAKKLDDLVRQGGQASKDVIDKMAVMVGVQERLEAMDRMAAFITFLKKMPPEMAVKKVNLVLFDYTNMSQFERGYMMKLFPFYSFKKGVSKYLIAKIFENPAKMRVVFNLPEAAEQSLVPDEKRLNRGILPKYLQDASIQIGTAENPRFLNLKGWSSLAEVTDFLNPYDAAIGMLSPVLKDPYGVAKNEDQFFQTPIEQYEGQKKNVFGIEADRRGLVSGVYKNLRPLQMLEQITEAALKDSKYSVFGTKEKKSWFGAGQVNASVRPKPLPDVLLKLAIGAPVTQLDVKRSLANIQFERKERDRQYKLGVSQMRKEYAFDPETFKRIDEKRRADLRKYLEEQNLKRVTEPYIGRR